MIVSGTLLRNWKKLYFFPYILVIKNKLCYNTNVLIAIEDCPFRVPRSLFNKVCFFKHAGGTLTGCCKAFFCADAVF